MTAGIYDFTDTRALEQGATFRRRFQWQTGPSGTPVDLTGYTAAMQVRPAPTAETIIVELTTADGSITLTDEGDIHLVLDAAATALLPAGTYSYDLELTAGPGGDTRRLLRGQFEISAEVTR